MRKLGIGPGSYVFPDFRGREAMKSERVTKLLEEGPVGHLSGWPTPLTMGGKMAGTAGILAYCFSFIPNALWFGAYKRTIVAGVIDGGVYGLITGAVFGWLWPD